MTGIELRRTQATSEWAKIFTDNITDNYTNSMLFMKQLTCIAVSTIMYMKNAFTEENYMTETFANIKLRLLKKNCNDETAQFVSMSLLAALGAVEKKYVHSIVLCFYEGDDTAKNLLEYHTFKYNYKSGEASMTMRSETKDRERRTACTLQDVKEQTLQLIRACMVFMSSSNLFTENTNIGIRIYFNSDTPDDYQVPGFLFVDEETDAVKLTMKESIKLGCVETPYHKLSTYGYRNDTFDASHEANPSQNVPVLTNDMDFIGSVETRFNCPCDKYTEGEALLTCQYCKRKQHAICYGIPQEKISDVISHCCIQCYDNDKTRTPTDSSLITMNSRKRSAVCLFRRALASSSKSTTVGSEDFVRNLNLSQRSAMNLMRTFFSYGIVECEPQPSLRQTIIRENLMRALSDYFQCGDRFIPPGDGVADPLSQVLTPSEQGHLQSVSSICEMVEITENEPSGSMKEYQGVVSDMSIGMPPIKMVAKRQMPSRSVQEKAKRRRK